MVVYQSLVDYDMHLDVNGTISLRRFYATTNCQLISRKNMLVEFLLKDSRMWIVENSEGFPKLRKVVSQSTIPNVLSMDNFATFFFRATSK